VVCGRWLSGFRICNSKSWVSFMVRVCVQILNRWPLTGPRSVSQAGRVLASVIRWLLERGASQPWPLSRGFRVKRANGQNSSPVLPQRRAGLFFVPMRHSLPIEESGRSATPRIFLTRVCESCSVRRSFCGSGRRIMLCWLNSEKGNSQGGVAGPRTAHPSQNRRRDAAPPLG